MNNALIGYTGFVGSNLLRAGRFEALFNSSNIRELGKGPYEVIVCAGAPGVKWKANLEPDKDVASIQLLMDCLSAVRVNHVVLISTIDVYPHPVAVDEDMQSAALIQQSRSRILTVLEEPDLAPAD